MTTAFKIDCVLRKTLCLSPNNQAAEVGETTVFLKVVDKIEYKKVWQCCGIDTWQTCQLHLPVLDCSNAFPSWCITNLSYFVCQWNKEQEVFAASSSQHSSRIYNHHSFLLGKRWEGSIQRWAQCYSKCFTQEAKNHECW